MEHDAAEGGLPLDISVLAELALSLDLPEATLGVLKAAQFRLEVNKETEHKNDLYYSYVDTDKQSFLLQQQPQQDFSQSNGLKVHESWLSKLGSWSEALAMYECILKDNPMDVEGILGCMRCLEARGEFNRVLELAKKSWPVLYSEELSNQSPRRISTSDMLNRSSHGYPIATTVSLRSQRKALKFCARAASRLGQCDELETYASELVHGKEGKVLSSATTPFSSFDGKQRVDFDGAFYSAVLHIHQREWSKAAGAIDTARKAMDSRFTALMAESYKRAYPSMVTAQTLAVMEEIVTYRKLEERTKSTSSNSASHVMVYTRNHLLDNWRQRLAECRVDAEVHSSILAVQSLILGPEDEVDATLICTNWRWH